MAAFSTQNSYLSSAIDGSVTTLPMINAASYPNEGVVVIDLEKIYYTGKTSTSLTGCTRGYDGTSAVSHIQYSPVTYNIPNQVMNHENGNDDRSTDETLPIEAYIETSDFDIGDGHNYGFVWRMIPDITFDGSNTATPNKPQVTFTVRPRYNPGAPYGTADTPLVTSAQSYNSQRNYTVQEFTQIVYTRLRGRQMAFKVSSNQLGCQWQLGTPRIDVRPDGRR